MLPGKIRRRAKLTISSVCGLLPFFEWKLRATRVVGTVVMFAREHREVRRIRRSRQERSRPLVATIIPTYQRPESLVRAVQSALDQTITDQVVVVVDDGGGLPALPADQRLVVHSLSTNLGVAGCVRNVGLQVTDSDYIAFLDDDNLWAPEHLERSLSRHGGAASITYTGMQRVFGDGTKLDVLMEPFDRRTLRDRSYIDINTVVVRRNKYVRFSRIPRGFRDWPGEDWELVWRLTRRLEIQPIHEITVTYRVHRGSYYNRWDL